MKKFTENKNKKEKRYSSDNKLMNDIYYLIEKCLIGEKDGKLSEKISILGKDDFANEICKIVENEMIKTKIGILEKYIKNPNMFQVEITNENKLLAIVETINNDDRLEQNQLTIDFEEWKKSDNVIKNEDGTYSTQDAQWRNKLEDLKALKQYFIKEFID